MVVAVATEPSLVTLVTESVLRNEYFIESDVTSVAVKYPSYPGVVTPET